jgi:hypothetical protein
MAVGFGRISLRDHCCILIKQLGQIALKRPEAERETFATNGGSQEITPAANRCGTDLIWPQGPEQGARLSTVICLCFALPE